MITIPKKFLKMSKTEQEAWLVNKLLQLHQQENNLRRLLAAVRGGGKIEIQTEERPDEMIMKQTG